MYLFKDKNNKEIKSIDFFVSFDSLKVHNAKYLYVHSDLSFGIPNT